MKRTIIAAALASTLAACSPGHDYPIPADGVASRLQGMPYPAELGYGPGGTSEVLSFDSASSQQVTWRVVDGGSVIGSLDAKLTSINPYVTRVSVAFRGVNVDGSQHELEQRFMDALGPMIMAEAIDAELGGHPYDRARVEGRIDGYAIQHRDEMQGWIARRRAETDAQLGLQEPSAGLDPQRGLEQRDEEARRRMEAASAPSLKLDDPDRHRRLYSDNDQVQP